MKSIDWVIACEIKKDNSGILEPFSVWRLFWRDSGLRVSQFDAEGNDKYLPDFQSKLDAYDYWQQKANEM